MLDINDFSQKQIIVFNPTRGDKISYRNDNMIVTDGDGNVKYQITCYRIFAVIVVGDCTFTTGIIRRAKKFGFSVVFMTYSFRYYAKLNAGLEGNSYLHEKQYRYTGTDIAKVLIFNKIKNQYSVLKNIRKKDEYTSEGIELLKNYMSRMLDDDISERNDIMAIEGNAARVYFQRLFVNSGWTGRKPRIKFDYINSLLDIGYTLLFNFIDSILQVYDFDVYKGVLHTCFYQRKSLVCDIMEPFRPIIDWQVRKGINLQQFKKEDFIIIKDQYQLEYKKTSEYVAVFMQEILKYKQDIFLYIRSYYRAFMKEKSIKDYPIFDVVCGIVDVNSAEQGI